MECSSFKLYNDILLTSFENFEDVLGEIGDEDTPQKRLQNSQAKRNDYAPNQQIGYGSYIFLTRDEEQEMRISWKDD